MNYAKTLAAELSLDEKHVENVIALIDANNTIPFIARYRKELTGSMDDQVLLKLSERLGYLRNLEKRREEITRSIEERASLQMPSALPWLPPLRSLRQRTSTHPSAPGAGRAPPPPGKRALAPWRVC